MIEKIDAHAHLNFKAFDEDLNQVIKRIKADKVGVINVGTKYKTSIKAVELTTNDNFWAIIGLHPIHTNPGYHDEDEIGGEPFASKEELFDYDLYYQLAQNKKVVGIGECGLDYFHFKPEFKENQVKAFTDQINLANNLNLPLMLHIRDAYQDAFDLVKNLAKVTGNVHFFAGSWDEAKKFLDLGFSLSFTGVITFARNHYEEVIKNTPIDMILAETDCPYVAPIPYRGKRNEPIYVEEVIKTIADIKKIPIEETRTILTKNTKRVFKLDLD